MKDGFQKLERQGTDCLLEFLGGKQPYLHLDFSPARPISDFGSPEDNNVVLIH